MLGQKEHQANSKRNKLHLPSTGERTGDDRKSWGSLKQNVSEAADEDHYCQQTGFSLSAQLGRDLSHPALMPGPWQLPSQVNLFHCVLHPSHGPIVRDSRTCTFRYGLCALSYRKQGHCPLSSPGQKFGCHP